MPSVTHVPYVRHLYRFMKHELDYNLLFYVEIYQFVILTKGNIKESLECNFSFSSSQEYLSELIFIDYINFNFKIFPFLLKKLELFVEFAI